MKIALVVHHYHQEAGHSRYVVELARRFVADHEVHVFANEFREDPACGITFHRIPAWNASALTRILTFIGPATWAVRGGFDIVHAQGACVLRCDVMTAHICQRAWFQARVDLEGRLGFKDHLFAAVVSPLERALSRRSRAPFVICISDRLRRDFERWYGRTEDVSVIHHGVALDRFSPESRNRFRGPTRHRLGLADHEVAFLFVGDLRKGFVPALRALSQAPGARLVAVSRTAPAPYLALAGSLGVAERVLLCPPTDQIEAYYAAADAFVLPTPYDAFGMVITEAMAAGLPVVTTRAAGASELIRNEENGLLLDSPFDEHDVARQLRRLTTAPTERERLGAAARRTVETLTWDEVARRTMNVYRQTLALRRGVVAAP